MPSETPIAASDTAAAADLDSAADQATDQVHGWTGKHPINVRLTVPFPFGSFYLVILGGRERRSQERRHRERGRHPLWTIGNFLFFLTVGTLAGLATLGLLQLLGRYLLDATGVASF